MRFSDFVTLQRGFDLPKTEMRDGPYPVLGSTSVIGFHSDFKVEPPGVITGRSGSLGVVQFVAERYWPHNTSLWVKDFKGNDAKYVYYCMKGLDFARFNAGAGVPTLNRNHLDSLEVEVPPFPTQRRIAGILSAYDELIENSQRRIKILEEMARLLYREWFVNFRYPGHESVPLVPSPLGKIPQGWEVKALNDVCSRITDGSHFSPPSVEDGFPMASVKDMHDWGINVESCRKIKVEDYEALVRNDCKPLKHDVLIAKDGSYLKHTFVVQEEQDLVVLSSIAMLRPNDSIRPNVLCFALRDPETKARMKGIVSGVAIPRIVLKDFRKFQILVPSTVVQAEWSRIVDPIGEACEKLISQVQNLRRTRDLLLPRLLSGQIDVESIDLQT